MNEGKKTTEWRDRYLIKTDSFSPKISVATFTQEPVAFCPMCSQTDILHISLKFKYILPQVIGFSYPTLKF